MAAHQDYFMGVYIGSNRKAMMSITIYRGRTRFGNPYISSARFEMEKSM
jgi:hypothetical protein